MRPPTKSVAWLVFLLTCLGVTLTTGRLHIRGDAGQMCNVAAAIGDHGWFDVPRARGDIVQGPDNKFYSKYPLLTVLQCAPALWMRALGRVISGVNSTWEFFFLGVVPAIVTGLVALFFLLCSNELGFSLRLGAVGALLMVFTTPLWCYGRELYSENLQAALLLATLWTALVGKRTLERRWFIASGVFSGLALLSKFTLIVTPGFLVLMVLVDGPGWKRLSRCLWAGLLGLLPFLVVFLAYNYLRFGSPFEQGYSDARTVTFGFGTPLYSGLSGLLFSSGKSVFLYAPLLIAALFGLVPLYRRHKGAVLFILCQSVLLFGLMAKWWSGLGDWAWGPRLVVPVFPLLLLGALEAFAITDLPRRLAMGVLALAGFVVNLLGCVIDHSHYINIAGQVTHRGLQLERAGGMIRDDLVIAHFVPEFSPPVGHYWLLDVYLTGWEPHHWTPWEGIHIPAWEMVPDPTPPFLNHWSDGSPAAWTVIVVGWTVVLLLSVALALILRRARARRLDYAVPSATGAA
ncbi:MAG: glycosyltransferase family 39 protein [Sandaracinaceae bacterium]